MKKSIWVEITKKERDLIVSLLAQVAVANVLPRATTRKLRHRLEAASDYPKITVGVYGGQVQWTLGNPFPLRICDYDGDAEDLPDIDDLGNKCRIWFEAPSPPEHLV